jgi:hypothetical protein
MPMMRSKPMPNKKPPYTLPEWTRKLSKPLSQISDDQLHAWGAALPPIEAKNQSLYKALTEKHRQFMELARELLSAKQCTRLARNAKVSPPPNLKSMFADLCGRVRRARNMVRNDAARREQEELEARRAKQREYSREDRARQKAEADALLNQRLEAVGEPTEEA